MCVQESSNNFSLWIDKLHGICKHFSFFYLHIGLSPHAFLRRSHPMLLQLCHQSIFLKHSPTSHLRHFTNTFCVTPLALHMRHISCASDGIGQCLLPHTSSLSTCDSMLGGLPNGLGTLRSGPACANIFLTRVYRKSLCDIFLSPYEEWRV